jgi:hypothetical protein
MWIFTCSVFHMGITICDDLQTKTSPYDTHICTYLTHMTPLCMFIYTSIIIQHVLIWDLNPQPLGSLHSHLLAMPVTVFVLF